MRKRRCAGKAEENGNGPISTSCVADGRLPGRRAVSGGRDWLHRDRLASLARGVKARLRRRAADPRTTRRSEGHPPSRRKEFRILRGEAFTVQRKLPQRVGTALVERLSDKTKAGRWKYDRQIDRYYFYDPDSDRHARNPPSTNIGSTENLFFHYWSISSTLALSCWEYFPVRVIVE